MVNLKRPTLQLQQLEHQPQPPQIGSASGGGDITSAAEAENTRPSSIIPTAPLNILKFNYDATTPLVNITLSIHPNPVVVADGKESIQSEIEEIKTVYTGQHSGGFNQLFTLPSNCGIDLSSAIAPMPTRASMDENAIAEDDEKKDMFMRRESEMTIGNQARSTLSEDTNRSSLEGQMQNVNINNNHSHQPDLSTVPEGQAVDEGSGGRTRGLRNLFGRNRRREQDLEAGQIEMTETNGEGENGQNEEEKEPERGMRLLIKIEGLGPEGKSMYFTPTS